MVLRELVGEEGEYGEETVTTVTIVITDIDDELPVFSRDKVAVPVPEDIGKKCYYSIFTYVRAQRNFKATEH